MRNLYKVIDDMILVVPIEKENLIHRLRSIQDSYTYAAPKLHGMWWGECADALNYHIPDVEEDWHRKIGMIFSGKKEEE